MLVESPEAIFSGSEARVIHLPRRVASPCEYIMRSLNLCRPCSEHCKSSAVVIDQTRRLRATPDKVFTRGESEIREDNKDMMQPLHAHEDDGDEDLEITHLARRGPTEGNARKLAISFVSRVIVRLGGVCF